MKRLLISLIFCILLKTHVCLGREENFIIMDGLSQKIIIEQGPHIHERVSACSTFKIALSLMGFDAGILTNETTPTWDFQNGYDDFLESWKTAQNPASWMKNSCVWYSRVLAKCLGAETFQTYLTQLNYGNQDMSGGLTKAWINSSLKISPQEQVEFLQKMLSSQLPISAHAIHMTRTILFIEQLPKGWKLFGKTGLSDPMLMSDGKSEEIGWFVGWIENKDTFFPFAYYIRDAKIEPSQRIPRVKQLFQETQLLK